jgi:predicted DNA-binding transcriptional regulator AlpA
MQAMNTYQEDHFIRAADVRQRYSISNVTLHRWVKSGKLPKPQYLNSQRVWRKSAIEVAEQLMLNNGQRQDNHLAVGSV